MIDEQIDNLYKEAEIEEIGFDELDNREEDNLSPSALVLINEYRDLGSTLEEEHEACRITNALGYIDARKDIQLQYLINIKQQKKLSMNDQEITSNRRSGTAERLVAEARLTTKEVQEYAEGLKSGISTKSVELHKAQLTYQSRRFTEMAENLPKNPLFTSQDESSSESTGEECPTREDLLGDRKKISSPPEKEEEESDVLQNILPPNETSDGAAALTTGRDFKNKMRDQLLGVLPDDFEDLSDEDRRLEGSREMEFDELLLSDPEDSLLIPSMPIEKLEREEDTDVNFPLLSDKPKKGEKELNAIQQL